MTLLEQFLAYIGLELGYSPLTVSAYRSDLDRWADEMTGGNAEALDPMSVTASDLRVWLGAWPVAASRPAPSGARWPP